MKHSAYILATVALAALALACQPDDIDTTPAAKPEYRIKSFDNFSFSYDENGDLASISTKGVTRTLRRDGKTLFIEIDGAVEYKLTINKDGFATKIERSGHNWTIDYTKAGYLSKVSLDGVQKTTQKVSLNNIDSWTKYDLNSDFWNINEATYLPKKNVGGVQSLWAEESGLERWMFEARLLGNASANVLESSRWSYSGGRQDENTSVYDYEYDVNGCIVQEIRYYGKWDEETVEGLKRVESHTFSWEK